MKLHAFMLVGMNRLFTYRHARLGCEFVNILKVPAVWEKKKLLYSLAKLSMSFSLLCGTSSMSSSSSVSGSLSTSNHRS